MRYERSSTRIASRTALVAALSATIMLATPRPVPAAQAGAGPVPGPAFGVNFHAGWLDYSNEQRIEVLDKLAAAGVKWVRIDISWATFEEHCRGCYSQWYIDILDFTINAALARGIDVLGMLWRTPGWANGGAGVTSPPSDPQEYGRAARWAADHFRGRVAAWEVWNEPNLEEFWTASDQQYVQLLQAGYPEFKAGDPEAEVVLAGPSYNDTNWLAAVYEAGAHGYFDVLATHPYPAPADLPPEAPDTTGTNIWLLSHLPAVRELMTSQGDGDKEIWFTEFGWSAHDNWEGLQPWELGVTPEEQGAYLIRAVQFVTANYPYVTHMFWYNERNRATGNIHQDNFGLLTRDLAPKPVYGALKGYMLDGVVPPDPAGPCTVRGTSLGDVLTGTPGDDVICAGRGHDVVRGGRGKDVIKAGPGPDVVRGGPGGDKMFAGPGRDLLIGNARRDRFSTGPGNDRVRGPRRS